MSAVLGKSKLVSFTMPEVIHPIIAKDPPKHVGTFKKERVEMGDVMYAFRTNDDRITQNIKQYPTGVNVGTNLSYNNSTRFIGGLSESRPQVKLPGSYLPGNVQHRIDYIPERYMSLSRHPFRWSTEITCGGGEDAKKVFAGATAHATGRDALPHDRTEYKTRKSVVVFPQSSAKSVFPCSGTSKDAECAADYYDLMQYSGFIIQDPLSVDITSTKKGFEVNADVDFDGIKNKMKQLLDLESHQNESRPFVSHSVDQTDHHEAKLNTRHISVNDMVARPFMIVVADEGQHTLNTRKVSDKELHNLQVISHSSDVTNADIERVLQINMRDKRVYTVQTNTGDNIMYVVPDVRPELELERNVPEYASHTNHSDNFHSMDNQTRDVTIHSTVKPKHIIEDVGAKGIFHRVNDERDARIMNRNYVDRGAVTTAGESRNFIPSNNRLGAVPSLTSKKINPLHPI